MLLNWHFGCFWSGIQTSLGALCDITGCHHFIAHSWNAALANYLNFGFSLFFPSAHWQTKEPALADKCLHKALNFFFFILMLNVWAGCVWIKSAAACRPPGAAVTQTSGNIRSSHCKRCTWSGSCNMCEVDASAAPRGLIHASAFQDWRQRWTALHTGNATFPSFEALDEEWIRRVSEE